MVSGTTSNSSEEVDEEADEVSVVGKGLFWRGSEKGRNLE